MTTTVMLARRHDTPQGQRGVQELHDTACRHGATCSASNVTMASRHEASGIQQIHDLMAEHGATCASTQRSAGSGPMLFSATEQRARDAQTIQLAQAELAKIRERDAQAERDRLLGMTELGCKALARRRAATGK